MESLQGKYQMNFWPFSKKDSKELFFKFKPQGSNWRVVTWNFDLDDPKKRQWTVEVHNKNVEIIQWEKKIQAELRFYENDKPLLKKKMSDKDPESASLMNLALHSTLKYSIEANHEFMVTPVPGATPIDLQNETKALQWIQASFGTLIRALDTLKTNKSLILTAACFSGQVPDGDDLVLRVVAFNLDIFYYMRPDQTLQIIIFNDKDQGHGDSKTPTFQQIIKVTKPQFYDEITKLLHRIAQIGEIS